MFLRRTDADARRTFAFLPALIDIAEDDDDVDGDELLQRIN